MRERETLIEVDIHRHVTHRAEWQTRTLHKARRRLKREVYDMVALLKKRNAQEENARFRERERERERERDRQTDRQT